MRTSDHVRTDSATGVVDEAAFVGDGADMFAVQHRGDAEAAPGLLVCGSIHGDYLANYRREVELGRAVADTGMPVQRFHYRGQGHSHGTEPVTLDTMVRDARAAADLLPGGLGAVMGTRWGAFVAAEVAAGHPGMPLVIWSPMLTSRQFLRDGYRAEAMAAMNQGREAIPGKELQARLDANGVVDVLGYAITQEFVVSADRRDLASMVEDRPVLLVDFATKPSKKLQDLAAAWRDAGCDVTVESVQINEPWWLIAEQGEAAAAASQLIERTTGWLREVA